MKTNHISFFQTLKSIVGKKNLLLDKKTDFYRTGFRDGGGKALAVVFPETLLQQWQVIKTCVAQNKIIIMQAANTGLTAGSTPYGDNYDREIIIINTTKLTGILLLGEGSNKGKQLVSFSGTTLHSLEKKLAPLKREPHSVIGSTCIGASIVGGIANNSGGALIQRGPAYTELSLYAQVNSNGELVLINHLGIHLGETPEEILTNLQTENFSHKSVYDYEKPASARDYEKYVRDIDADTPARFNADKNRLFEASGCAGKLAIFAVRLDTFPMQEDTQVYYIGANQSAILTQIKYSLLKDSKHLPISAEYLHRDIFNIAEKYGKDIFLMIQFFGTKFIPKLFSIKSKITRWLNKISFLPKNIPDRFLQRLASVFPNHLPKRMLNYRDLYEHHLILKSTQQGIKEVEEKLNQIVSQFGLSQVDFFTCNQKEANKAFLHRFAAASAAIGYQLLNRKTVDNIIALDVALARNDNQWTIDLPEEIADQIESSLYYGHFFCNVFHCDYLIKKGADAEKIKTALLEAFDKKKAKYPAEHNVGHLYQAEADLKKFYHQLDPTNTFNPGIGGTPKNQLALSKSEQIRKHSCC